MFKLYDKVKIKKNGITGVIVDIYKGKKGIMYTIESDTKSSDYSEGDYKSLWPLYDCISDDLECLK